MVKRERRYHYHVYVVELSDEVWNAGRFRRANPDYRRRASGCTSRTAAARDMEVELGIGLREAGYGVCQA